VTQSLCQMAGATPDIITTAASDLETFERQSREARAVEVEFFQILQR